MAELTEEQKYDAQIEMSNEFNRETYDIIQKISQNWFGKTISADSMFWTDLEEHIIKQIENEE